MKLSQASRVVALGLIPDAALGAHLLASHYTGRIHSLTLTGSEAGNASLTVGGSANGCGGMPAWLQLDADTGTLYCVDESWFGTGFAASFAVTDDGSLALAGQAPTTGSSVHSTLYGGDDGKGFLATSEYDPSTITTYALPLGASTRVRQQLKFTMAAPGPHPRQDRPHPHAAFPDPTGRFLLVPDLGADLIRIFAVDPASGALSDCGAGQASPGDGPRHGTFWAPEPGSGAGQSEGESDEGLVVLYTVNELSNSVTAWDVEYPEAACLVLTRRQTLSTYAEGTAPPAGSKASELHAAGRFLYAANRGDQTFGPEHDSIATYAIDAATGALAWLEAADAHAWYPRTFALNAAGTLVAVGGQTSSNVAILERDPESGRLGGLVANARVATPGTPGNEDGLSAVVWDE
jgi:6-phosphogluconolactonase (cycloisomerase 2 family)